MCAKLYEARLWNCEMTTGQSICFHDGSWHRLISDSDQILRECDHSLPGVAWRLAFFLAVETSNDLISRSLNNMNTLLWLIRKQVGTRLFRDFFCRIILSDRVLFTAKPKFTGWSLAVVHCKLQICGFVDRHFLFSHIFLHDILFMVFLVNEC